MARIRTTKPEFWSDSKMKRFDALTRLVFLCLFSMADDEGRIEGDADTVWRFGYFREDSRDVARALEGLASASRVVLYEVDGNPYIAIPNFIKHQKIDHPSKSKLPDPSMGCDIFHRGVANHRECSRNVAPDQVSGIRDQVSGNRDQGVATLPPGSSSPPEASLIPDEVAARPSPAAKALNAAIWTSYAGAYRNRYGCEPVRNATVNSQIAQLAKRLGADAPAVAAHYVEHNLATYVRASHPVSLLLRDCEGLRTQWARGEQVTQREASERDKRANQGQVWGRIAAEEGIDLKGGD